MEALSVALQLAVMGTNEYIQCGCVQKQVQLLCSIKQYYRSCTMKALFVALQLAVSQVMTSSAEQRLQRRSNLADTAGSTGISTLLIRPPSTDKLVQQRLCVVTLCGFLYRLRQNGRTLCHRQARAQEQGGAQ